LKPYLGHIYNATTDAFFRQLRNPALRWPGWISGVALRNLGGPLAQPYIISLDLQGNKGFDPYLNGMYKLNPRRNPSSFHAR